jgi:hypothetical protein
MATQVWDIAGLLRPPAKGAKGEVEEEEGKEKELLAVTAVGAHEKEINGVAVSPNDTLICTASQDRTAKVLPVPTLVLTMSCNLGNANSPRPDGPPERMLSTCHHISGPPPSFSLSLCVSQ